MQTLQTVLLVFISLYILAETAAAIYIYRKRATVIPRLRQAIGRFIGTSDIGAKLKRVESKLDAALADKEESEDTSNVIPF